MSESVNLPALGESVTEGTVTRWLKNVGDRVEVDEPLVEVSTDKVDTEIPSPIAGIIEAILVAEDETVEVGTALVTIGDGSAGAAPAAPAQEQAPEPGTGSLRRNRHRHRNPHRSRSQEAAAPAAPEQAPAAQEPEPEPRAAPSLSRSPSQPPCTSRPPAPRRRAAPEPTPVAAPAAPRRPLRRRLRHPTRAQARERARCEPVDAVRNRCRRTDPQARRPRRRAPGRADRRARRSSLTAARHHRSDVAAAQGRRRTCRAVDAGIRSAHHRRRSRRHPRRPVPRPGEGPVRRQDRCEAHLPAVLHARRRRGAQGIPGRQRHDRRREHRLPGTREHQHRRRHRTRAADTGRSATPPTSTSPDSPPRSPTWPIARGTTSSGPDELAGGTFTVTNTGSRGALFDTPLVFLPQSAILGTGLVVKKPVVVSDSGMDAIAIRSVVYLALSYDHRVVDGADAARFLVAVKDRLEGGDFAGNLGI